MASYLSEEWFEQIGAAANQDSAPPDEATLVVQHTVTGGPGGQKITYHVRYRPDGITVVRGPAARPDVTFAEDYTTAAAIAAGRRAAPAAVLAGDIRVGGDLAALIAHQDVLGAPDPLPALVRAETTF